VIWKTWVFSSGSLVFRSTCHLRDFGLPHSFYAAWYWRWKHYSFSKHRELLVNRHGVILQKSWIVYIILALQTFMLKWSVDWCVLILSMLSKFTETHCRIMTNFVDCYTTLYQVTLVAQVFLLVKVKLNLSVALFFSSVNLIAPSKGCVSWWDFNYMD
jgi:hypothetical protein